MYSITLVYCYCILPPPPPPPPPLPSDACTGVVSSELCRFCKYIENRDIAKEVLREKGMKKIKFGVEGLSRLSVYPCVVCALYAKVRLLY